ncbi:hypothetical protein GCM10028805_17080 [Spirosoma harenae]
MNALIPFSASSRPRRTILFFLLLLLGNLTTQAQNNWTGATDRAWNTAGNWSAGIPTAGSDVVIPSTPTNQPIISTEAVARTVEVKSGALLIISNSGSLTINGSKSVGGVNPTTGFYNGGSVLNQGAVVLGNQSSVGQYGLANVASFSNTSGGSISIDRAIFCGLFNRDGSFVNTSRLIIGGSASVGQYGLINSASFSNTSSGSISIDRTSAGGLLNDRAIFVNSARITIGASATVGADGLHNNGLFSNTEGGNISIDRASNIGLRNKDLEGSVNTTGGSFVNSATITIGASVTGTALDNRSVVGSGSQNVPVFNNQGCSALLQSLGNAVITNTSPASFSNTGTIIENTSDNSSISYNGGLVQNLNGGTFNVTGTNTGVVTTTPEPPPTITATPSLTITQGESATLTGSGASSYSWSNGQSTTAISVSVAGPYSVTGIIGSCSSVASVTLTVNVPVCGSGSSGPTWTGCVSTDWSTAGNWASGAVPTASDDVVIPAAPANQPVLSTTATAKSVAVQTGASLTISSAGSLTINSFATLDGFPTAFYNQGTVTNNGTVMLGNTAPVGLIALHNTGSFTNTGTLQVDRATNQGINNRVTATFTNTGLITIGTLVSMGTQGIWNQAAFSNTGGTITIDRTTDNGLLNSGNFTNSATITIGATAAVGGSGLYNLATFANQAGGRIQIDNSTGTGLFNAIGSRFTNSAMLIIGASAAVGLYGLYNRPNATFENQAGGYIQLDNSTYVGLYNPGETFINSGTITIGSLGTIGGTGIRNEGPFANRACATLTVLAPIINSNSFTNVGLFTVNTTGIHNNNGTLTNNGIIDYPQGNPILNVVNNDVIAAPIVSCNSTFNSALQLGGNSSQFTVGTTWYKDQSLTESAGTYNQGSNTLTATNLTPGSSTILYFAATDVANSCTKTVSISVTINAISTVNLINNGPITCTQASVTLTASGGDMYQFSAGATQSGSDAATATVSMTGVYSVTVISTNGCSAVASTTVTSNNELSAPTLQASAQMTTNQPISVTANGCSGETINWNSQGGTGSANGNVYTYSIPGNYTLTATCTLGNCTSPASTPVSLTIQSGVFTIMSVTTVNCSPITPSKFSVSFSPQYSGLTGQPISFSVVNELLPTSEPGPYTIQLYTDNPVITLKATQSGSPSEASFVYNWLAACQTTQNPNTAPTVVTPLANQTATVGNYFSYVIPPNTFTDAETPLSLQLSARGVPEGLNFSGATLSGTLSTTVGSPFSLTIIATDPGGLTVSTLLTLSVLPATTPVNPTNPFAITAVTTISCTPVASKLSITFAPRYSGLNGQAISFEVINEMVPTTNPAPYSLTLYRDNPVITLKATQTGSSGPMTFTYNWLDACMNIGQDNTPPRLNSPVGNQTAVVGQGYSLNLANTFADQETPNQISLSASKLPAGLSLVGTSITGTPSVSGVSTITITATDPGSLTASTSFQLMVNPAGILFGISGVQTISCEVLSAGLRKVTFTPQYTGVSGEPISFSVVNEMLPTMAAGPYQLNLYTDNPVVTLSAKQGNVNANYVYSWLTSCPSGARQATAETRTGLQVQLLGNPVIGTSAEVEIRGVSGQRVELQLMNLQGGYLHQLVIEQADLVDRLRIPLNGAGGALLLQVRSGRETKILKVIKNE